MFLKVFRNILGYIWYLVLVEIGVSISGECKIYLVDNWFSDYGCGKVVCFINRLGCQYIIVRVIGNEQVVGVYVVFCNYFINYVYQVVVIL